MTKTKFCIGCDQYKPSDEVKLYIDEELCRSCRNEDMIFQEYFTLENKEAELYDKLIERESELEYWKNKFYEARKKVDRAREKYALNQIEMVSFEWNRWVLDETSVSNN
ncbi:hypothetical protein F4V43_01685 [Paenibacillus spiritus]|uniref:Uncharacterized protein n=1 Tax=Paenibacillus spiritus TaxID=2496557 RepID=A0A5J5GI86_9BACL|nr:hypothetical protein [Paenibacillus spiritus]KAA9007224.1 hypothetical protein F4V43_01685 [Paenibacillus spiritus]